MMSARSRSRWTRAGTRDGSSAAAKRGRRCVRVVRKPRCYLSPRGLRCEPPVSPSPTPPPPVAGPGRAAHGLRRGARRLQRARAAASERRCWWRRRRRGGASRSGGGWRWCCRLGQPRRAGTPVQWWPWCVYCKAPPARPWLVTPKACDLPAPLPPRLPCRRGRHRLWGGQASRQLGQRRAAESPSALRQPPAPASLLRWWRRLE